MAKGKASDIEFNEYTTDFFRKLKDKYGQDNVTKENYQKELLAYIKNADKTFMLNNLVRFINETALDATFEFDNARGHRLVNDKDIMPYQLYDGLMKNNTPSKKVYEAIGSSITKDEYVDFCNDIQDNHGLKDENLIIEDKMKRLKAAEALKPKGNAFTTFFKKLFNIGGYNDKMAAYEHTKQSVRDLIGDRLTDAEFETHIQSEDKFSTLDLHKAKDEPLKINELDEKVDTSKVVKEEVTEVKEKELNI